MIQKIHLNTPGGSKRGVKLREIDTKARELAQVTVAKRLAGAGLTLLLFCGFCLTKIGGAAFDVGATLETWARRKRGEIAR